MGYQQPQYQSHTHYTHTPMPLPKQNKNYDLKRPNIHLGDDPTNFKSVAKETFTGAIPA